MVQMEVPMLTLSVQVFSLVLAQIYHYCVKHKIDTFSVFNVFS